MLTNVDIFNQYVCQTSAILRRAVALKRTACYALRANHCIHANSNFAIPMSYVHLSIIILAAVGSDLTSELFFTFSKFVMQTLGKIPPNQSSAAMLSINVPLHNKLAALDLELPENFPKSQPYVASWSHGTT
jgi:hypothetical protein